VPTAQAVPRAGLGTENQRAWGARGLGPGLPTRPGAPAHVLHLQLRQPRTRPHFHHHEHHEGVGQRWKLMLRVAAEPPPHQKQTQVGARTGSRAWGPHAPAGLNAPQELGGHYHRPGAAQPFATLRPRQQQGAWETPTGTAGRGTRLWQPLPCRQTHGVGPGSRISGRLEAGCGTHAWTEQRAHQQRQEQQQHHILD
jgi:hypothetical protein